MGDGLGGCIYYGKVELEGEGVEERVVKACKDALGRRQDNKCLCENLKRLDQ